jgi:hypothetical protein
MRKMHRRHFVRATMPSLAALALTLSANVAPAQQMPNKPQVRLSEMRPAVMEYVERMSKSAKEQIGIEFSKEKKIEMVNIILSDMEAQGIYDFVDP